MLTPGTGLTQKIRQQQALSLQQQQGLQLLQMPRADFEEFIGGQLLENPLLEIGNMPDSSEGNGELLPEESPACETEDENRLEEYEFENSESWQDDLPVPDIVEERDDEREEYRQSLLSTPEPSLREELQQEIEAEKLPPAVSGLLKKLLHSLDSNGLLPPPQLKEVAMSENCDLTEIGTALEILRRLSGIPALGAGTQAEAIALQLRAAGKWSPLFEKMLGEQGFSLLKDNKFEELLAFLAVGREEFDAACADLRGVSLFPASMDREEAGRSIYPDLEAVRKSDGSWEVLPLRGRYTNLEIPRCYSEMLKNGKTVDAADKKYLRDNLHRAEALIDACNFRYGTLVAVGQAIVDSQLDFFENGTDTLRPLTMNMVADKLGLNVSTVSRAVADKYLASPGGLYPLHFFFEHGGVTGSDGEMVGRGNILERIRDLVETENPAVPLTDDDIAGILVEEGINISRRTVAKYRESMNIAKASQRRTLR